MGIINLYFRKSSVFFRLGDKKLERGSFFAGMRTSKKVWTGQRALTYVRATDTSGLIIAADGGGFWRRLGGGGGWCFSGEAGRAAEAVGGRRVEIVNFDYLKSCHWPDGNSTKRPNSSFQTAK